MMEVDGTGQKAGLWNEDVLVASPKEYMISSDLSDTILKG